MWKTALLLVCSEVLAAPPAIHICHKSDPGLQTCLKEAFNNVFRRSQKGLKELGLPPLEPFLVPLLEMKLGAGNVSADIIMRDVQFTGLTLTEVITVKANMEERKMEVTSRTPSLEIIGNFALEGGLLSFPLYASGHFHINASDVLSVIILYYKTDEDHLAVESLSLDLIPSIIAYDMGDSLDGDNKMGEVMNGFLNENSHEVFTALKPRITKLLGDILGGVIDHVLHQFSVQQLLPD